MALRTTPVILGVDVSRDWLDVCLDGAEPQRIANRSDDIDRLLRQHPHAAIGVEATGDYHELLCARAQALGLRVYLISGYALRHYAEALGQRMRHDAIDARLLARYLSREIDRLRPWQPSPPHIKRLRQLLKRRHLFVQQREQLRQSLASVAELADCRDRLLDEFRRALHDLDRRIRQAAHEIAGRQALERLVSIPGVGPLNAAALLTARHSGEFPNRDAFIAYLGLDVRTKDSGKHRGRRKLSKRGEPEYRRLLHCAAMSACQCSAPFAARLKQLRERGLSTTAAYVVIARQIARLAYTLMQKRVDFDPDRLNWGGAGP